jgi:hypothetical protein
MIGFARHLVLRLALAATVLAPAFVAPPAEASVSIAVQFDELVEKSKAVAVEVPIEQRSVWEGRFIITYTKVHVDDGIAGAAESGKEVWIVSRGGSVGNIGQSVDGEPVFHVGHPSLAFLREDILDDKAAAASGIFVVTARAQGLFPIVETEVAPRRTERRILSSPAVGVLLPPRARVPAITKPLAHDILHDKSLDEARGTIVDAWRRLHAGR